MSKCRKCGAEICFVTSRKGRPIPCDLQLFAFYPNPRGPGRYVTRTGELLAGQTEPPFEGARAEEGCPSTSRNK